MYRSEYMFVKYRDRNFPVTVSVQNNKENLAFLHFHEEVEILKVSEGVVSVKIGTCDLKCYKGDILFLPPNTLHQVNSETKDAEIVAIAYKEEVLKIPIEWSLERGEFKLFNSNNTYYEKIDFVFSEAIELYKNIGVTYQIEMTACLLKLISIFIKDEIAVTCGDGGKQRLLPVLEYIRQNVESDIKISDLQQILYVSKEHLIRLFKAETGKTPLEYIIDFKLQKAMLMLEENNYSVSEISDRLSFANPSYFSKVFRQRLKMTPSEYRKRHNCDIEINE